jgi:hypothetical protein
MEMFANMNLFAALWIASGLIGTFLVAYMETRSEMPRPADSFFRWLMILWCSMFVGPYVFLSGIAFIWLELFDGRKSPVAAMIFA